MTTPTTSSTPSLSFHLVPSTDLQQAIVIEELGFPADEAASLSSFQQRQSQAPELFLGAYSPSNSSETETETETLLGYICSTLTPSSTLTHESMSTHIPSSPYVAIHSVCVHPKHRQKGVASQLMKEYMKRMIEMKGSGIKGGRLIAHEELVEFYKRCGWTLVGKSEVKHGERDWFELKFDLPQDGEEEVTVEEEEEEGRSPGKPFSSFSTPTSQLVDSEGKNLADLFCPRKDCACLLLRKGVGKWVDAKKGDFLIPPLPSSSTSTTSPGYWSISSPLSFENIGFSRSIAPPSTSTSTSPTPSNNTEKPATMKFLICADCDVGPLGFHDTQGADLGLEVEMENEGKLQVEGEKRAGRDFWLDSKRCRYRV